MPHPAELDEDGACPFCLHGSEAIISLMTKSKFIMQVIQPYISVPISALWQFNHFYGKRYQREKS